MYLLALLYLTFIYVRPGELIPGWEGFPFVQVLSGVVAVVGALSYLSRPRRFWGLPHDRAVLAVWVCVALSQVAQLKLRFGYEAFADFFRVVFFYFLIRFAVRTRREFEGFIAVFLLLNLFLAGYAIRQYAMAPELEPDGSPVNLRLWVHGTGIFDDPNDLALTLNMAVPFLLTELFRRDASGLRRLATGALVAPIVGAIFLSNSRGGMIGLGAAITVFSFWRFGTRAGVVAACLGLGAIVVAGPSRLALLTSQEGSAQGRIQSWSAGLAMLKSHPLFGVGFNRYTDYNPLVAHNSFVHCLGELGLVGTCAWTAMSYWLVKGGVTFRVDLDRVHPEWKRFCGMNTSILGSAAGMLTSALFLSRQYTPVLYALVAIGACHAEIATAVGLRPPLEAKRADLKSVVILTACGVIGTWVVVRGLATWSGG
ncbi:MAG TPA: O-antigen ligase family protein [Planctomycetota bacterium]|nr:O-antigen ligase family protein [Planctomycetota bacterium]